MASPSLKTFALVLITAIIGGAVGIGGYIAYERVSADAETASMRPEFELPDLDGQPQSVTQWDGKILAINFWASWCPPCVREIPHFIALQEQYGDQGVQFVGIAVDRPDAARQFAEELGVNYPLLYGVQNAMEVSERYGNLNGTLPYTVVIGRDGLISDVFAYEVDYETIEQALKKLL